MLKTLFSSNTRVKLLTLFFTHPEKEFYLREIEKLIQENITSVRREVISFKKIGLLNERIKGNNKYYYVNKDFSFYPELKGIIFKTTGIKGALEKALEKIKKIKVAFIYGSYASGGEGEGSDVDVVIVGDPEYSRVLGSIKRIEKKVDREIDFVLYKEKEFLKKLKDNYFIKNVIKSPKLNLVGNIDEYVRKIIKGK